MAKKTQWQKHVSQLRKMAEPYQNKKKCPTPNKIPYANLDLVNDAVTEMHVRGKYVRSYNCDCGVYHTSTQFPRHTKRGSNKNRKRKQTAQQRQQRREKQRQREKLRAHNRAQVMST